MVDLTIRNNDTGEEIPVTIDDLNVLYRSDDNEEGIYYFEYDANDKDNILDVVGIINDLSDNTDLSDVISELSSSFDSDGKDNNSQDYIVNILDAINDFIYNFDSEGFNYEEFMNTLEENSIYLNDTNELVDISSHHTIELHGVENTTDLLIT
jgi:hypothetical protein